MFRQRNDLITVIIGSQNHGVSDKIMTKLDRIGMIAGMLKIIGTNGYKRTNEVSEC